jgi:hypothetical protein
MKNKHIFIITILIVVISAAYLFTRFSVLRQKKIFEKTNNAKTVIDLKPAIVAKIQQLVNDGSDGLYNLQIQKIEPNILKSKVVIINASLAPDTAVLEKLDKAAKAPDDVFEISFHKLQVEGISLQDLLRKKNIDLKAVYADQPNIKVYHTKRAYNEAKREKDAGTTVYQKIMKQLNSVIISKIVISKGSLAIHDVLKKSTSEYKNVSVNMSDILINSNTQYDKNRFLFAKKAEITTRNYIMRTSDSLYLLKFASVDIQTASRTMIVRDAELVPRLNKREFQKKLTFGQDMYTIKIPKLSFFEIDWWKLANTESFTAKQANIYDGRIHIYRDLTLPGKPLTKVNNFPHQLLMKVKSPILLSKLNLFKTNVTYQAYDPYILETGTISFNDIKASGYNITNIKSQIKKISKTALKGSALFMNKIPLHANVDFDLNKIKTGNYTADVHAEAMDTAIINPFAEPMGLVKVKSGVVQNATVHIEGDNLAAKGKIVMLYKDLKITPLKKRRNRHGDLKKKDLTGTLANILFIKNSNPGKSGEVRAPEYNVERGRAISFTKVIWQTILTGILKTVGIPSKFGHK